MRKLQVLVFAVACSALLGCQSQPPLEVYGSAPSFALTDQKGAAFTSDALAGRVTLLDFVYTHCTDACPLLSATFQQAQTKLADEKLLGERAMLVSLSVDPQHDTPSVLDEYAAQFKADPRGWKFLTGDWDQVYDVVTGFKVATRPPRPALDAPAPGGTELTHTTRIILLDGDQQVRAYLDSNDATADDLVKAVKRALK
jgi:cytochrome oxidase Cu insertion factor (SCO1/SenC/PrrC family)